jgi:hypothetical protein
MTVLAGQFSYDCYQVVETTGLTTTNLIVGAVTNWQDICGYVGAGPWDINTYWNAKSTHRFRFQMTVNSWATSGPPTGAWYAIGIHCSSQELANGCYKSHSNSFPSANGQIQWNHHSLPY